MSLGKKAALTIFLVLLVDQIVKIWIKTHMQLYDDIRVFDWFYIRFVENNGMAFGIELGGSFGKLILSIFRLVAIGAIIFYLFNIIKNKAHAGLIISVAFILAGALGNLVDSAFYGIIFNSSNSQIAQLFPAEGGYSSFLHGRVVDMLYFPLIESTFPHWVPFYGGESFVFFSPVFNISDSAITIGVAIILLFQKKFFKE
jgi:signal peptidase II